MIVAFQFDIQLVVVLLVLDISDNWVMLSTDRAPVEAMKQPKIPGAR